MRFYRAVQSPEHAQADLERGHSFHQTEEYGYDDEQINELLEDGELEKLPNGNVVVPLAGLCGFDSPEQVKRFAETTTYGPYIAVYEGRYAGQVYDGDLFRPERLVRVVHQNDFDPAVEEEALS